MKRIMNGTISNDILQVRWPLGVPPPSQPETRYDVQTWSLMNETHQIMPNSEENIKLMSKIDQEDVKVELLFGKNISVGNCLLHNTYDLVDFSVYFLEL